MSDSLRKRIDDLLTKEKALPTKDGTVYTESINLGLSPAAIAEQLSVELFIEAAAVSSGGTITLALQDSADNSSFANVSPHTAYKVTAGASSTSIADIFELRLPDTTKQFIRAAATAVSSGDSSASDFGIRLMF